MLDLVEARNSRGSLLSMPLEDPPDGLVVEKIEGLGPVEATLVSSNFASLDGESYQSGHREIRDITFTFSLDSSMGTVADLRRRLYDYFMPKTEVDLRFYMSDLVPVRIVGHTKSMETALFAKDPTVDVVVRCFDPDFLNTTSTVVNGLTTGGADELLHAYSGTIETGVLFRLLVNRGDSMPEFSIYNRLPNGTVHSLDISTPLINGDVLEVSTVPGAKRVTRIRDGVSVSLLYTLSPQSNWIKLQPGDNYIRFATEGVGIPFEMLYTARYGGL